MTLRFVPGSHKAVPNCILYKSTSMYGWQTKGEGSLSYFRIIRGYTVERPENNPYSVLPGFQSLSSHSSRPVVR